MMNLNALDVLLRPIDITISHVCTIDLSCSGIFRFFFQSSIRSNVDFLWILCVVESVPIFENEPIVLTLLRFNQVKGRINIGKNSSTVLYLHHHVIVKYTHAVVFSYYNSFATLRTRRWYEYKFMMKL